MKIEGLKKVFGVPVGNRPLKPWPMSAKARILTEAKPKEVKYNMPTRGGLLTELPLTTREKPREEKQRRGMDC